MEKEEISILAQFLTVMKDAAAKLEEAQKTRDLDKFSDAKREILSIQAKISKLLLQ